MEKKIYVPPTVETAAETRRLGIFSHISWSSIFAGLVTAMIVQFLLTLLGIGIGMATVQPLTEQNPMEGLGTGAIIWWVITILVSLFTGGWVAARWSDSLTTSSKVFHGLLTWGLFTIVSFYLFTTTVGGIISGVGSIVGKTLSLAGQGIQGAAPAIGRELEERGFTDAIKREIEQLAEQSDIESGTTGGPARTNGKEDITEVFERYKKTADQVDREALINVIMERTGKSRAEAEAKVEGWERQIEQISQEVEQRVEVTADQTAKAISKAAFIAFIALVIGAVAAAFGGGIATTKIETVSPVTNVTIEKP